MVIQNPGIYLTMIKETPYNELCKIKNSNVEQMEKAALFHGKNFFFYYTFSFYRGSDLKEEKRRTKLSKVLIEHCFIKENFIN